MQNGHWGRLIKLPQNVGFQSLVSDQCGNILKELVHLILSEETRLLISNTDTNPREPLPDATFARPIPLLSQGHELAAQSLPDNYWSNGAYNDPAACV